MGNDVRTPELSVQDALIGELLGELVVLRQDLKQYRETVTPLATNVEKAGELVSYRIRDHAVTLCEQLDESVAKLTQAAGAFQEVREMLIAELSVKTSAHFKSELADVAKRVAMARRFELFVASAAASGATVALVFGLHLLRVL